MTMYEGGNGRVRSMPLQLSWPLLPSPYWAVVKKRGEVKENYGRMKVLKMQSRKIEEMTPMDAAAYYYPWSRLSHIFRSI